MFFTVTLAGHFEIAEKGGGLKTISIGPRQRPTWVRGRARLESDEIILDERNAETYTFFEPDQCENLLLDLAELRLLGSIADFRVTSPHHAIDFTKRHGLLWHRPGELGSEKCRESLTDWLIVGHELSISIGLYMKLQESVDTGLAEPLRQYLLPLRDLGIFYDAMPDYRAVEEFQNRISTILAERVNTGMAGCNQTFVAACSLVKNGEKVGGPADFRYSVDPQNLVAAAYNEFASLIVRHARFKKCLGCGRYFRSEHGNQDYCEPSCSTRTRKREQRKRKRSPA